jgi:hypothetical protein
MVAKNRTTGIRKTPKHVTTLIDLHRRLLAGLGPKHVDSLTHFISDVGVAIEKALLAHGVNPRGEACDATGRPSSARGGPTETGLIFWSVDDEEGKKQKALDYAGRVLRESLTRLRDAADLAGCVFKGRVSEAGMTPEAFGGLIESGINEAGREIEQVHPDLGLKLDRDKHKFLTDTIE